MRSFASSLLGGLGSRQTVGLEPSPTPHCSPPAAPGLSRLHAAENSHPRELRALTREPEIGQLPTVKLVTNRSRCRGRINVLLITEISPPETKPYQIITLQKSPTLHQLSSSSLAGIKMVPGLPWWLSDKESACQCRRCGFDSWSGKIPHAAK